MRTPATHLRVEQALNFYRNLILRPLEEKRVIGDEYQFPMQNGAVSPMDWELFAAILIDLDRSPEKHGPDLAGAEVKVVAPGRGAEYQYHRREWKWKLHQDAHTHHVAVCYGSGYRDIDVLLARSELVHDQIRGWRSQIQEEYEVTKGKRSRWAIGQTFLRNNAIPLLTIRDGELTSHSSVPLADLLSAPAACMDPGCAADEGARPTSAA